MSSYIDAAVAEHHSAVYRSTSHTQLVVMTGNLVVDLNAGTVEVDGRRVYLSRKEYNVLELFSFRKGAVPTAKAFMDWLHGDACSRPA